MITSFPSKKHSVLAHPKHLRDIRMPRLQSDSERHRRAAREPIVFAQVDRLAGDFVHVEGPQHAGDGEPDLALGDDHAGADAAADYGRSAVRKKIGPGLREREEELRMMGRLKLS